MSDENWYHVGWPSDPAEALDRMRRGLPVYWPRDPKPVDQTPYLRWATERGPNSE